MKRAGCLIVVFMAAMPGLALAEEPVYFADDNLKAVVEAKLGISDPTPTDMLTLNELNTSTIGIYDLTGLEYATNLTSLELYWNQISDISTLSGLTNLTYMDLSGNQISDISALSGLTNLEKLFLQHNQISDISALSGLTNLTYLGLYGNQVSDISALSGLTELWYLGLGNNQISDISALSGLTYLYFLDLRGNPLNQDAYNIYIPLIRENNPGIYLYYDPPPPEPPEEQPTEVLSPVAGDVEVVYSIEQCSGTKWCFNQHKTGGHRAGGGLCQADDTYAWDINLNYPTGDLDDGKPVYAVAPGIVCQTYGGCINAGGSYGQVLIEHNYQGNIWWSGYLHLGDIRVTPGQSVDTSTVIGRISNTSPDAIPNHLHFIVYTDENIFGGLVSFDTTIVPRPPATTITTYSPVDLTVTDPDGFIVSKQVNEISGASYFEYDINGDGELDDAVTILERKIGNYSIEVVPEPDALPTDTYTLQVTANGETISLADDVLISNIPDESYIIGSTEDEITPIIPATTDFDPDTLNLKSDGKWITVYIELPVGHGYDASDINVGRTFLEGLLEVQHSDVQDAVLMAKFDRQDLIIFLESVVGIIPPDDVPLTVTGELKDGRRFEGSDTVRVIKKGGKKK